MLHCITPQSITVQYATTHSVTPHLQHDISETAFLVTLIAPKANKLWWWWWWWLCINTASVVKSAGVRTWHRTGHLFVARPSGNPLRMFASTAAAISTIQANQEWGLPPLRKGKKETNENTETSSITRTALPPISPNSPSIPLANNETWSVMTKTRQYLAARTAQSRKLQARLRRSTPQHVRPNLHHHQLKS